MILFLLLAARAKNNPCHCSVVSPQQPRLSVSKHTSLKPFSLARTRARLSPDQSVKSKMASPSQEFAMMILQNRTTSPSTRICRESTVTVCVKFMSAILGGASAPSLMQVLKPVQRSIASQYPVGQASSPPPERHSSPAIADRSS